MKRLLLILSILLIPLAAHAAWEYDLIDYPANPIFDPPSGNRIYYPTVLYDASGFGDGSFYKMWFSDGSGNIGTAQSDDGIVWTEEADVFGLTNPHHSTVLYDEDGFGAGGVGPLYKIWYWDTSKLYSVDAIRVAESDDGMNWVNDQPLTTDGLKPIISGGAGDWNRGSYGPIHLFYQPGMANSGDDPFGYEYVMYFDGTTGGFEQAGLGYSSDGIHWVRYGDDPILASGADWQGAWGLPDPWDSSYIGFGTVLRDSDGVFHWFYCGGTTSIDKGIGYASSDDGLAWMKDATNPFVETEAGTWYSKRAYTPTVLYDSKRFSGHGQNSKFKLWYTGRDDTNNYQLGYLGRNLPTITVGLGPANPEVAGIWADGDPAPLMQIALDNDNVDVVRVNDLTVNLSGTVVDANRVEALRIYLDDGDGRVGASDELLDEVEVVSPIVKFESMARDIDVSSSEIWLIVADLSDGAEPAQTITASILTVDDIVTVDEVVIAMLAEPLEGNTQVVVDGSGDGDAGATSIADDGLWDGIPSIVNRPEMLMSGGTGGCSLVGISIPGSVVMLLFLFGIVPLLFLRGLGLRDWQ
jgi:hypothetical protein